MLTTTPATPGTKVLCSAVKYWYRIVHVTRCTAKMLLNLGVGKPKMWRLGSESERIAQNVVGMELVTQRREEFDIHTA